MGEYLVGACLKMIEHCEFVDYNVRPSGGRLEGLTELDVIGFKFNPATAYVCEVVTHVRGLKYGNYQSTVRHIRKKFHRQKQYRQRYLKQFKKCHFMLWSPVVPQGLSKALAQIEGLELITNQGYSERINDLCKQAKTKHHETGNPAFRLLQILGHMKKTDAK